MGQTTRKTRKQRSLYRGSPTIKYGDKVHFHSLQPAKFIKVCQSCAVLTTQFNKKPTTALPDSQFSKRWVKLCRTGLCRWFKNPSLPRSRNRQASDSRSEPVEMSVGHVQSRPWDRAVTTIGGALKGISMVVRSFNHLLNHPCPI